MMSSPVRRGFFLTFEGLDGSGKSTQLRELAANLRERGLPVLETRQPGGTLLGEQLRSTLLEARNGAGLAPLAELALMFADRAQAIHEVIEPALACGQIVLCDRWTDSTEAYQGGGRQLGRRAIETLHRELCGGLQPDLTLLLLPSLTVSLQRARGRDQRQFVATGAVESRFESEADTFFERVHAAYLAIGAREPVRVVTIDGGGTIEEVRARVVQVVNARLNAWMKQAARLTQ